MKNYKRFLMLLFLLLVTFILTTTLSADEKEFPRVALVLSGGAARGLAHIGVISVLEEYHVPIDIIIGVSMGSIVGGYYAYGYSIDEMLSKARDFSLKSLIDFNNPKDGLLSGEEEEAIFRHDLDDVQMESLKIPLVILSTNIDTGEIFTFNTGPLTVAMRSSSAIPGVFNPVYYNGYTLVDGGVLNDIPIDIAKDMGADVIIVSNVSALETLGKSLIAQKIYQFALNYISANKEKLIFKDKLSNNSMRSILYKTLILIEQNQKIDIKQKISRADFIIEPVHNEIKPFDFYKVDEGYDLGREATLLVIDNIVQKINNFYQQ